MERIPSGLMLKVGAVKGFHSHPYLFILCSQLLSNAIEQRGQSLGIHISSSGPKISHLLYAEDVLIFYLASIALANALKTIVEEFCKWIGQRVNFSKSQIIFGKVVRYPMKKKIARVLGFKVVKKMN
ncbi:putative mitochondrial protein [Dendrobium catenatum]|uniref:Putative mitochondrial protein n=1 Tax=Dendrobium catenatum TaxID=906689 RepID=A0A2I0V8C8_9ASPA|nr:putative mitochondrial protein [Dendrobium catenatum]